MLTNSIISAIMMATSLTNQYSLPSTSGDGENVVSSLTAAEAFKAMPDSLLPYLTQNNRLDMLDFMASNMKAAVSNLLEGTSEMTALADDSLTVKLNEASTFSLYILPVTGEAVDSCRQVICLVRTWTVSEGGFQSQAECYSRKWRKLSQWPPLSETDRKRMTAMKQSTILKNIDKTLNKQ